MFNLNTHPSANIHKNTDRDHKPCWRLHDGVTEPVWSVYDETDPARGVVITYSNGDYASGCGANRDFEIRFLCTDNIENYPDKEEVIKETHSCHYEFEIETTHGCPTECPITNDLICAGLVVLLFVNVVDDSFHCFLFY